MGPVGFRLGQIEETMAKVEIIPPVSPSWDFPKKDLKALKQWFEDNPEATNISLDITKDNEIVIVYETKENL